MSETTAPKKARRPRTPKNRVALPVRSADAPPIPDFAPVPRVYNRHDGWTPERQRTFIGALADTGCVTRAAAEVNMAQANCYTLRRAPGAEEFRRAWDAALDCGLKRLKDIAFERAIEGELVPVFSGGKLMGHRRKRNDALLMFILRHYGEDRAGKRTTINYFSTRASAGAGAVSSGEGAASAAQASSTTVRTVISGGGGEGGEEAQALLAGFEGVPLDGEARATIMAALHECAARTRALEAGKEAGGDEGADWQADDPGEPFVPLRSAACPGAARWSRRPRSKRSSCRRMRILGPCWARKSPAGWPGWRTRWRTGPPGPAAAPRTGPGRNSAPGGHAAPALLAPCPHTKKGRRNRSAPSLVLRESRPQKWKLAVARNEWMSRSESEVPMFVPPPLSRNGLVGPALPGPTATK